MSHRITLRRGRKAAAATLIAAAAAVALTACEGGKADAGASPAGSVRTDDRSPAKDSPEAPTSQDGSAKGQGTTPAQNISSGRNGGNNSGNGGGSTRCTTDTLQAGWGGGRPDMHSDAQQTATVRLKNTGSRTCTLGGFPGVQIKGKDGGTLDLPRSAKKPVTLQLKPGAHASFTMALLPSVNGDDKKVEPGTVLITPPNEKKNFTLKWPYGGAILDQSGATHPGTYVNPIAVG
ncbi:DUF4232 domain-containing protein [Streptomyces chattanoogensis]|uniref:DUF4232 domain-containing protein n=1 Tax=Streptomyces chattanoogensis TaxID=66876 RepID=A0A0N0GWC9_9ACTN|nr:DUF4232 domain-containing protein [Streptomyces chattanoogensis]KPC59962.1 hypothetical protein ADL29_32030 [Streptomyces chattanoogensis]